MNKDPLEIIAEEYQKAVTAERRSIWQSRLNWALILLVVYLATQFFK
jgi:hypothetical protein